ncbi:hypothetical protein ABZ922_40865 [Streptomyces shenzhenensis]|uniref:hypothetical protein n=1 Tax=Streptomyces shenzhenensis TaxID=943815 RepID=UPI0033D4B91A
MSETDLLTVLRELDDPEWLERPRDHSRSQTAALFSGPEARLANDFATRCVAERDTQDSSEYGRVAVPAEATVCGTRIVVCVSKFGPLALLCADNPGVRLQRAEPAAVAWPAAHLAASLLRNALTITVRGPTGTGSA